MAHAAPVTDAECCELLATASWDLARKLPFLGHVLAAFDRIVDHTIPTAAVGSGHDGHPVLFVNPSFYGTTIKRDDHRVAVLEHEVGHVIFGHIALDQAALPDARRRAIAADLVVNQYVTHPLPRGAVTLAAFKDFPAGLTVESYYRLLSKIPDEELARFGRDGSRGHDRWSDRRTAENGRHLVDALDEIVTEALRRAERDGSFEGLSKPLRLSLLRGRLSPAGATDWRRALHLFSARALRAGVRATNQRESRRYGASEGDWRGPIVPGLRRGRRPSLAVAVDTSGSIDLPTLGRFYEEVARIVAAGATVHVIECDLAVQRTYAWTGVPPRMSTGGGGTSFDPVFRWLKNEGRRLNLSGVIYLTDGHAPRPLVRPPCPVLWALTSNGTNANTAFGPSLTLPA
jgi:predicted metal-dependent peptidase